MKGYKHTPEARAKMKDAWTRRGPVNETTRAKMSAIRIGRPKSAKTRARISAATKGRLCTEETRTKLQACALIPKNRAKISARMIGDKNPNWNGGIKTKDGYEYIRIHPRFYILTHRRNMMQILGRKLFKGEIVHHVNRQRMDNRPENLALCSDIAAHHWCASKEAKIFFG